MVGILNKIISAWRTDPTLGEVPVRVGIQARDQALPFAVLVPVQSAPERQTGATYSELVTVDVHLFTLSAEGSDSGWAQMERYIQAVHDLLDCRLFAEGVERSLRQRSAYNVETEQVFHTSHTYEIQYERKLPTN